MAVSGGIGRGMFGEVSVIFDHLPDGVLYPNRAGKTLHWGVRADARKTARQEGYYLGYALDLKKPKETVAVQLIFYITDQRRRDLDNLIAASKPWLDGLVDAGVLAGDDCWHIIELSGKIERGTEAKTEINIKEVGDNADQGGQAEILPEMRQELL